MATFYGIDPAWAANTDAGRTHIITKGIVQDGLVFNIDAGVSTSYPGTGSTWTDLEGNENLTLYGSPPYTSLNGGGIVLTTATYARTALAVSTTSAVSVTGDFTIEQVFKPTAYQASAYVGLTNMLLCKNFAGNTFNYVTQCTNNTTFSFMKRTSPESIQSVSWTVPAMLRNVNHATVVISGLNVSLYFNSVFISTQTLAGLPIAPNATNEYVYVSPNIVSTQTCFLGEYYAGRIYNRTLSNTEIKKNFNAVKTRYNL